jgi:hypothetical protein
VFITYDVDGVWSAVKFTITQVFDYLGGYAGSPSDTTTPTTVLVLNTNVGTYCKKVVNTKIYLKDPARVQQAGTYTSLNIGFEQSVRRVTNALTTYSAVYGKYMRMDTVADITPQEIITHSGGCPVTNNTYSEVSPQPLSPLTYFGLITNTQTIDQGITTSSLETYAISLLNYYSYYYKKATFWAFVYDYYKSDVRPSNQVTEAGWIVEGDRIAALQNQEDSIDDMKYGMYKNRYQIIQWKLNADTMIITLELGDQEKNVFTIINEKTQSLDKTIT